jgi:hypothetical protein
MKDWISPDFVRYTMDMEQGLQQMKEGLLARQEEEAAQRAARQE